jgi:hypothetical protein
MGRKYPPARDLILQRTNEGRARTRRHKVRPQAEADQAAASSPSRVRSFRLLTDAEAVALVGAELLAQVAGRD